MIPFVLVLDLDLFFEYLVFEFLLRDLDLELEVDDERVLCDLLFFLAEELESELVDIDLRVERAFLLVDRERLLFDLDPLWLTFLRDLYNAGILDFPLRFFLNLKIKLKNCNLVVKVRRLIHITHDFL